MRGFLFGWHSIIIKLHTMELIVAGNIQAVGKSMESVEMLIWIIGTEVQIH